MKRDIIDQFYIEKTDRSTAATLVGEMIDIGYFDTIDIKSIFKRITTSDDQVVTLIIYFRN